MPEDVYIIIVLMTAMIISLLYHFFGERGIFSSLIGPYWSNQQPEASACPYDRPYHRNNEK